MISKQERFSRAKMALGSILAYALILGAVLWFDRANLAELGADHVRLITHGHFFLGVVVLVWVLGFERYNPLVAAVFLVDILLIAWDRVSWGAIAVVALGIVSCVYASVRNISNERGGGEPDTH